MDKHSVWVVVVRWNDRDEVVSASKRLAVNELDESAASMAVVTLGNLLFDEELDVEEEYELLSVWGKRAESY